MGFSVWAWGWGTGYTSGLPQTGELAARVGSQSWRRGVWLELGCLGSILGSSTNFLGSVPQFPLLQMGNCHPSPSCH